MRFFKNKIIKYLETGEDYVIIILNPLIFIRFKIEHAINKNIIYLKLIKKLRII
jgi:hypothetical protein